MAVPTITSVSPSAGRTAGRRLVRIVGTNFAQYAEPPTEGRAPKPIDPIRVLFGAEPAMKVWVLSKEEAVAMAPPHEPGLFNVVLTNLDSSGVPIPGETATKVNGFEFKRPDLTAENPLEYVSRTVIRLLKNEVIENVSLTTHTEFDASPEDGCNIVEIATLPALVLVGPRTEENRFYSTNQRKQVMLPDGTFYTLRACLTVDLIFDLVALSNSQVELLALMKECSQCVFRTDHLPVLRDQKDPSAGIVEYHFHFDREFEVTNVENPSNMRQASATVRVFGVDLDDSDALPGATGTAGEAAGVDPSWVLNDFLPPGSVQRPDGVIIGTGAVAGQPGDGPYQYRSEDYWKG